MKNGILPFMHDRIYLGLGTNLGDRLANLDAACEALPLLVTVVARSPIYQTAPWGFRDQPEFLNQVIRCKTELSPRDLLTYVKAIEQQLGREPTFRFGPRLIDIDILLYADLVYQDPGLQIPHASLQEREFVLIPLCDLSPDLIHPVSGKRICDLSTEVGSQGVALFHPADP